MRVAVVGAGAVGGTIAALLDRGGHEVVVTARGENLDAIRQDGIYLSGSWGQHRARVAASELLPVTPSIAFVCVKAQDAPTALRANAAQLAGIRVVIAQNGLDGLDVARRLLPDSECVGAVAVFAADRPTPGHVSVATPGPVLLGDGDGNPSPAAGYAATVLATVMPAAAVPNFTGVQWTKLVVNQLNAIPAITGLSVQEVLADHRLRRIIAASMREATVTARALGVRFGSIHGLNASTLRLLSGPLGIGELFLLASRRGLGPTPVSGSTLQSIRQGHATEIDYLSGVIVARAKAAGCRAPVNAALTELVHEVERTGRFLTTDELAARVSPLTSASTERPGTPRDPIPSRSTAPAGGVAGDVGRTMPGMPVSLRIFVEPQQGATYDDILAAANATADLGFDGFFRSDHFIGWSGDGGPGPTDAWSTLAGLARDTTRIRLGTLVTSATFRHPGLMSIQVAGVDQMSHGRLELGIGTGWVQVEHTAYGIPFPPLRERAPDGCGSAAGGCVVLAQADGLGRGQPQLVGGAPDPLTRRARRLVQRGGAFDGLQGGVELGGVAGRESRGAGGAHAADDDGHPATLYGFG